MKAYRLKIDYHNKNGDFEKGDLWKYRWFDYEHRTGALLPKDFVENNPAMFEPVFDLDALLKKAQELYPKGTWCRSVETKVPFISSGNPYYTPTNKIIVSGYCVYDPTSNTWAKRMLSSDEGEFIEDGDEYYTVFLKGKLHIKPMVVYGAFKFNEPYILDQTDKCKYFKHKENAERFVELNINKLIHEGLEEKCKELISYMKESKLNYKIKIKENKFKIER